MARMHSRKKGKSGSKKPLRKLVGWVEHKPKEVEDLVLKFAKQGMQTSRIGITLRDQYGIPSVKKITKKSITQIVKENELYPKLPEDLYNLLKKAVKLRVHMEKNRRDFHSYRGLELTESKIRRLAKFYARKGLLPKGWVYDPEKAKLLIK